MYPGSISSFRLHDEAPVCARCIAVTLTPEFQWHLRMGEKEGWGGGEGQCTREGWKNTGQRKQRVRKISVCLQ